MQDFRDNNKKIIKKMGFFGVKFVMGYPCVRHYILFYIHGPVILHFELIKYYKIENGR